MEKKSSNSQERNPLWSAAIQHLGPSEETESHPGHHPLIMMYQVPAALRCERIDQILRVNKLALRETFFLMNI